MKFHFRRIAVAAALSLTLIAQPWAAIADDSATDGLDPHRVDKFFEYASCALSIAVIGTGAGAALAVLACGKIVVKYWTE